MIHAVDFHCHLDLFPDYEKIISETEAAEIYTLAVTTTPRAWKRNYELTKHLKYVRPALGLHPQLVGRNTKVEFELWKKLLPQTRYVGEVGIDGSDPYIHTLEEQKKVFADILDECSKQGDKILSIHAVNSVASVLDLLEAHLPPDRGVAVIHWFSGSIPQVRRAIELGCYFSINGAMIQSKRGRTLIKHLPYERILLETDGPFIKDNEASLRPKDVLFTARLLSDFLGVQNDEMNAIIMDNLKKILTHNNFRDN